MCPEPATSSDSDLAPGAAVQGAAVSGAGVSGAAVSGAAVPDDALPAGLIDALRSDLTAAALRRQRVARIRSGMRRLRLDDAELIEGIATSLLADSGAG